jgi:hypothetical protein
MNRYTCLLVIALLLAASMARASATWYVDAANGNDTNDCHSPASACRTIGHAISLASSGDSIVLAAATYAENLTLKFSINIFGSSATTTIIDGGRHSSVLWISSTGANVRLSNLTIQNGLAPSGGGIYNTGILTINQSTLSGNEAFSRNLAYGGGIVNSGTVTINNSTLSGNIAQCGFTGCAGGGGAIENYGRLTINNSTISGNSASTHYSRARGGAIANGGTVEINNSTLSGNATSLFGQGGGIYNSGTAMIQNSILANSGASGNCYGAIISIGYNLSSDSTCNFSSAGDLNNDDPLLGPLQNNGGPTETMALLPGSPAIDAGNPAGCTDGLGHLLTTDQRGAPRPDKEDAIGCDRGAYESQSD